MVTDVPSLLPGPPITAQGLKLPEPLPAGVLPPEDSRMWHFTPRAVQEGEGFIKDDTRDWFEDRDRKVVICRNYPDHPRWQIKGSESVRAKIYNSSVIAEIHMLARITAGRSDVPEWVPARMSVKQQQADLGFRLVKTTRDVFRKQGKAAMETFAEKAPGQFIKFIGATFVPKQLETTLNTNPNEMSKEVVTQYLDLIADELNRRTNEARVDKAYLMEYEGPENLKEAIESVGHSFSDAAGTAHPGATRMDGSHDLTKGLRHVVDIMTTDDGWGTNEQQKDGEDDGW